MISLYKDLNPLRKYAFQVSGLLKESSGTAKTVVSSGLLSEDVIKVERVNGDVIARVWSFEQGWNIEEYTKHVCEFVALIDGSQEVSPEFIECALHDGLGVADAVNSWFKETPISVQIEHHLSGFSGLLDIDIGGIGDIHRVVLPMDIQEGDVFNVYHGKSSKSGGVWSGDLVTSLEALVKGEATG